MKEKNVIDELYEVIKERQGKEIQGSYTSYLFEEGLDKILKKVGEEASEVIIASKNQCKDEMVKETCDLIYHLMVLMVLKEIKIEDILAELEERRKKMLNKKPDKNEMPSIH